VTEDDSLAAGNCRAETDRAEGLIRARCGLSDRQAIQVRHVLAILSDSKAILR
jgi:hypothetical protein